MSSRRTRPRVLVALATVLAVSVGPLLPASPASAQPPRKVVLKDGRQDGGGYDVTRVVLRSAARKGARASARIAFAETPDSGDGFLLWLDLDRDKRPDALISAYAESEWYVDKARSWTRLGRNLMGTGCFRLGGSGRGVVVRFDPHCLARPNRVRVSVQGFEYDGSDLVGEDYAPGERAWSKPVRAYR